MEREIQNRKTREKTNTLPDKSTDIGRLLAQLQHPFSLGVLTVEFIIDTAILQFYIPYHSFEIYHFISFVFFYAPTAIALRSSAIVRFRGRIALGLSLVLWGRFVLDCQKVPRKVPPRFRQGFTEVVLRRFHICLSNGCFSGPVSFWRVPPTVLYICLPVTFWGQS